MHASSSKRRTPRGTSVLLIFLISFFFPVGSAWAQGTRIRAEASAQEESDQDRPLAREHWLRLGRQGTGETAAWLRYRAYQQKMAHRALRAKAETAASSRTSTDNTVTSATAAASGTPAWTPLGPAPIVSDPTGQQSYGYVSGRATRVLVDQSDPTGNTVYLGGAYGGLWKSTNAATANPASVVWTPLLDDQPTLAIGAIAIKPGNNNTLLVGTGEPNSSADSYYGLGMLRSTDGGASWNLILSADNGSHPFKGLGFSRIVFSGSNPNLAVAATAATNGSLLGATGPSTARGLYYSADAGLTWQYASVVDGSTPITPGSATSVVYNAALQKFFAVVRYHGIYSSSDGAHWIRLGNQPGGSLLGTSACPAATNSSCPLYRGELALLPGTATMFVWVVDSADGNHGIFSTTDGGATWTALDVTGINNCGDTSGGCGTAQGGYNLALAAVPSSGGIDLYAGAENLFKCSMSSPSAACAGGWKNLTHVYGCSPIASPSLVHPDQHDIDFSLTNSNIIYLANDGGIYRTLSGPLLASGSCTGSNPFDNLNATLGSMTEFVSFSLGTDSDTLLGGTQDNGSPATVSAHSSATFNEVNGGDGGFNAINPSDPQQWLTANSDVSIQRCDSGFSCTAEAFPITIGKKQVGGDHGDFYTPFILDPQMPNNVIVGTCRVWRGSSDGVGWPGANNSNAISGSLTGDILPCTGGSSLVIRALAAGGPADGGGSQVIYVGTSNGRIYVSSNATTASPVWNGGSISVAGFPISDIAIDPGDASGMTAWATVMGFGVGHIFTTKNGLQWQDTSGNLPDAPANSVLVDPADSSTVYVGTDIGVFVTRDAGTSWAEYGPGSGPGFLPSAPVTRLRALLASTPRKLRASTYGRGIWEIDMPAAATPLNSDFVLSSTPMGTTAIGPGQSIKFNITVSSKGAPFNSAVTLSCGPLPAQTTCTFQDTSVTPGSGGASTTLTIATGGSVNAHAAPGPVTSPWLALWLAAPLPGISTRSRRGPSRRAAMLLLLLAFAATAHIACGGGAGSATNTSAAMNAATPTGSYTVVVTGTSGSLSHSSNVSFVVN